MNGGEIIQGSRSYSVTIQRLADKVPDDDGFESEAWEDYYTNYAYINGLSGNERWTAAQVSADRTVRFTFRWHDALDAVKPKRHRIIWQGRVFTITFVDNVMYKNETVRIDALEVDT